MNKKITAKWDHAIWIDCPHCERYFDYMDCLDYKDFCKESNVKLTPGKAHTNLTKNCIYCNTEINFDLVGDFNDDNSRPTNKRTKPKNSATARRNSRIA